MSSTSQQAGGTDRPRIRTRSRALSGLQLLLGLSAVAAAVLLWSLGRWTTIHPTLGTLLLAASTVGGALAMLGSRYRRIHRVAGTVALLLGSTAVLAGLAFPVTLYRVTPSEPLHWSAAHPANNAPGDQATATEPRRLRVVQWNILHDFPDSATRPTDEPARERIAGIQRALQSQGADIVVLQEAWSTPRVQNVAHQIGTALGLHVVYARANGSRRLLGFEEGVAVLSRHPLARAAILELSPRKHLFDRRIALQVDVALSAGEPVRVIATHLTNEAPRITAAQAHDLALQVSAERSGVSATLLAGDFNAPPSSQALRQLHDAGWSAVAQGDRDHVLLHAESTGWRRLWSELVAETDPRPLPSGSRRRLSDHPILVAELESSGPPRASRWTGGWEQAARGDRPTLDPVDLDNTLTAIGLLEGIESVLVVHDGALVGERYFRGATPERLQNMKSASKSLLSSLVGIAIEQGHLDLDDRIDEHLAEARGLDDRRKGAITVHDLLSMKSGLESTSFGNYGSWVSSPNWVRNALQRPLLSTPGTRFGYSTGDTHVLSAVLTAATGQSTLDFAREHLFDPLGIQRVVWERDRQGIYVGGNNLTMRPRDLARFGLLYLDRGLWGDRQVVPWEWVDRSTVSSNPGWTRSWGGSYGYLWWIRSPEERGAYNASGFGGQYLFISRAEDLVVVVSSTEVSKPRGWRGELFSQIRDGIVEPIRRLQATTVEHDHGAASVRVLD